MRRRLLIWLLAVLPAGCAAGDPAEPAAPAVSVSAAQSAGAGSSPGVLPAPGSSAVVPPAGGSPAPDDPPGARTCARLADAVTGGTLMDPGVIAGIASAAGTADAPVADAADRLAIAHAAATAAAGTPTEPDAIAAVTAAAADMSGVCADSGLTAVG